MAPNWSSQPSSPSRPRGISLRRPIPLITRYSSSTEPRFPTSRSSTEASITFRPRPIFRSTSTRALTQSVFRIIPRLSRPRSSYRPISGPVRSIIGHSSSIPTAPHSCTSGMCSTARSRRQSAPAETRARVLCRRSDLQPQGAGRCVRRAAEDRRFIKRFRDCHATPLEPIVQAVAGLRSWS